MSVTHKPSETQPPGQAGTIDSIPGTMSPESPNLSTVPPLRYGTTPSPFRIPCPTCGTIVVVPYDPVHGVLLDWLLYIEEHLQDLSCPGATMVHEIVVALQALRETLEVHA